MGSYRFQCAHAEIPAPVSDDTIAGDELSICVVLDPKNVDVAPQFFIPFGKVRVSTGVCIFRKLARSTHFR